MSVALSEYSGRENEGTHRCWRDADRGSTPEKKYSRTHVDQNDFNKLLNYQRDCLVRGAKTNHQTVLSF